MAVRLSALLTGRTFLPRNIVFVLLVLRPGGLGKLEKFIHLIGHSALTTELLRAPIYITFICSNFL
jgi:hypothetical protein